jgi:hypothetical protein
MRRIGHFLVPNSGKSWLAKPGKPGISGWQQPDNQFLNCGQEEQEGRQNVPGDLMQRNKQEFRLGLRENSHEFRDTASTRSEV